MAGLLLGPPWLVFLVLNFFDIFIPTGATAAAFHTLFRGRADIHASSGLRHDCAPVSPGIAGLRIILGIR